MKRCIPILLLSLVSCQGWFGDDSRLPSGWDDHLKGTPVTPPEETVPQKGRDTTVYVTAVSYPAGIDWVRDSGADGVQLLLFADGEEILSLPVGESHLTSPDPDMHRVCWGHLYTDYSTKSETVVMRDGKEIFRFTGRESLKGFCAMSEDYIVTLGQNRDGDGWTLRKNGEEIASSPNGILLQEADSHSFPSGALQTENEHIWFFYHIPQKSWRGIRPGEYFLWKDGQTYPISLPELADKVFDLRVIDGKTVMYYSGAAFPEVRVDGSTYSPGSYENALSWCRLFPTGDGDFRIAGSSFYSEPDGSTALLWDRDRLLKQYSPGEVIGEYCFERGRMAFVSGPTEGFADKAVVDEKTLVLPEESRFVVRRCALLRYGKLYLALSGENARDSESGLWVDGEFTPYNINGPLTGVWVVH